MDKFDKLNDFVQVDGIIYRVVAVDNLAYLSNIANLTALI